LKNPERQPHGLLGQTAHLDHTTNRKGKQGEGEIEGVYTDYIVSSMYSVDDIFNRFSLDKTAPTFTEVIPDSVQWHWAPKGEYQTLVKFMQDQCDAK